jgi:hypothetical protein
MADVTIKRVGEMERGLQAKSLKSLEVRVAVERGDEQR